MIRVLHSVSNMDRAGIETMLMNYYRHMDKGRVQFDFLCNKTKTGAYDEEIVKMGGRIFHTPGLNPVKYPKYISYMKKLFSQNPQYKIVEAHNGALGVYALHSAKINHIPVRVFHAHGASITKDWKWPLKIACKSRLKANSNHNFTCGKAAAECYFGKKTVKSGNYEFIPNAIEVEKFVFNKAVREDIRKKYHLENKNVIGHVGRFMVQKNHRFLIKLFSKIAEKDKKAVLVLLGDGELMKDIKLMVQRCALTDKVIFVGNVENANEWYNAFDVFVLPSIWEGLPVVGVEAQANDLPCVFSDCITKEIGLSDKVNFLTLTSSLEEWAERIMEKYLYKERKNNTELITEKNYNIHLEAKKLEKRYLELYGEAT